MKRIRAVIGIVCIMMLSAVFMYTVKASTVTSVPVTARVTNSFTISIPSDIQLTRNPVNSSQFIFNSVVGVKGSISSKYVVKVVPSTTFTMYDVTRRPADIMNVPSSVEDQAGYKHNTPVTAFVTQGAYEWTQEELQKTMNEEGSAFTYNPENEMHTVPFNITAPYLRSGKWEGIVQFNISYERVVN